MSTLAYPVTKREILHYRKRMRRQRELRKRVVLAVLTLFLALVLGLSYNVIVSQANDDMSDVSYKYFTYHEVSKGDTLWSIAESNINYEFYDSIQDYVDEVTEINHLKDETIKVGQSIVIPYFSSMYY